MVGRPEGIGSHRAARRKNPAERCSRVREGSRAQDGDGVPRGHGRRTEQEQQGRDRARSADTRHPPPQRGPHGKAGGGSGPLQRAQPRTGGCSGKDGRLGAPGRADVAPNGPGIAGRGDAVREDGGAPGPRGHRRAGQSGRRGRSRGGGHLPRRTRGRLGIRHLLLGRRHGRRQPDAARGGGRARCRARGAHRAEEGFRGA